MGEKRGMKALEAWCKKVTQGYRGVKIDNMTTSWRDGLAFCAIIHHFRPELIDFDSLDKNDIYRNNELAFRTAERHLGIPALLDSEDMVEYPVPDRLSILTYLSQFYQAFAGIQEGSSEMPKELAKLRSSSEEDTVEEIKNPLVKMAAPAIRRDPCAKCGLPVFIAERLLVGGNILYHRTCFRCARCENQLSLANCYETEDGQHCCETCPDEVPEEKTTHSASLKTFNELDIIGNAGLDDEYSKQFESLLDDSSDDQEYSKQFELLLEDSSALHQESSAILQIEKLPLKSSKERSDFMASQLLSSCDDSTVSSLNHMEQNTTGIEAQTFIPHSSPSTESNASQISLSCGVSSKIQTDHSEEPGPSVSSSLSVGNKHSPDIDANSFITSDEVCDKNSVNSVLSVDENGDEINTLVQADGASKVIIADDNSTIKSSIKDGKEHLALNSNLQCEDEIQELHGAVKCTKERNHSKMQASSIVKTRLKMFESSGIIIKEKETKTNTNIKKFAKFRRNSEEDGNAIDTSVQVECSASKHTGQETCPEKEVLNANVVSQKETNKLFQTKINDMTENDPELLKLEERVDEQLIMKDEFGNKKDRLQEVSTKNTLKSSNIKETVNIMDGSNRRNSTTHTIDIPSVKISSIDIQEEVNNAEECSANEDFYPKELNPFDEDGDTDISEVMLEENNAPSKNLNKITSSSHETPTPAARKSIPTIEKMVLEAPKISLNPFWSDGEEPSSDEETRTMKNEGKPPVPLPRTVIAVSATTPEPSPPLRKSLLTNSSKTSSMTSLSSINSSDGTGRKKKPAPAPPTNASLSTPTSSRGSSPTPSSGLSPIAPRRRKSRPAPPPPGTEPSKALIFGVAKQLIAEQRNTSQWEREKNQKDLVNLHRQSQVSGSNGSCTFNQNGERHSVSTAPNKSTYGQWKRKKGPAPPRPVPQRRQVKAMPMKEVARELEDIEVQQQELERQGVKLEQTIREKFDLSPNPNESSMTPDVEELVLQLFELVNQKNELFRRQAGLMYLRRQHRLEEEHADLEYQIRCLMEKPEHNKTDYDKAREEELIQQLIEVVERRNEVVECLELDRIREEEEDRSIHSRLGMLAGKSSEKALDGNSKSAKKKKNKKSKAEKDKILSKKATKLMHDADKDVDEVEGLAPKLSKEKKSKLKWF